MRGYWAQVWRSVLAWMDLGETERLYLEGAEDIDRISGLTAETIQVKDVVGNITLRSGDVVEAIDNAWAHQQRNPRHTIKFRFLTTARIAVEQGAPFGTGIGGLGSGATADCRDDAAQRERDARAIATFLLAEGRVSVAVQGFLRTASDEQIWQSIDCAHRVGHRGRASAGDHSRDQGQACGPWRGVRRHARQGRGCGGASLRHRLWDGDTPKGPVSDTRGFVAAIPRADPGIVAGCHRQRASGRDSATPGAGRTAAGGRRRQERDGRPAPPLPARYYARETVLADIATAALHLSGTHPARRHRRRQIDCRRRSCGGVNLILGMGRSAWPARDRARRTCWIALSLNSLRKTGSYMSFSMISNCRRTPRSLETPLARIKSDSRRSRRPSADHFDPSRCRSGCRLHWHCPRRHDADSGFYAR